MIPVNGSSALRRSSRSIPITKGQKSCCLEPPGVRSNQHPRRRLLQRNLQPKLVLPPAGALNRLLKRKLYVREVRELRAKRSSWFFLPLPSCWFSSVGLDMYSSTHQGISVNYSTVLVLRYLQPLQFNPSQRPRPPKASPSPAFPHGPPPPR